MNNTFRAGVAALSLVATPALADSSTQTYKDTCIAREEVRDGVEMIIEDQVDTCGEQFLEVPIDEKELVIRFEKFGKEINQLLTDHDRLIIAIERFNNRNKDTK